MEQKVDIKYLVAIYLALLVFWFICMLYSVVFKRLSLKESLKIVDNDYFLVSIVNMSIYFTTLIGLLSVVSVFIYNLL